MNRLYDSSMKRVSTMSLEKKKGRTALRIFRDIRSLQKDIGSYLSKIRSARDHTLNLLEELETIIEDTASKKVISWNTEDWDAIDKDLQALGVDQHGTNLDSSLHNSAMIMESLADASNLQKKNLDAITSPDIRCLETFSPMCSLPKGLTYVSGGIMAPLGQESPDEPMLSTPELIARMEELNGGTDIAFSPLV